MGWTTGLAHNEGVAMYILYKGLRMEVPEDALRLRCDGRHDTSMQIRQIASVQAEKPRLKERMRPNRPVSRLPRLQQPKCNRDVTRAVRSMGAKERLQFATS
jgi:hypothetical protein